MASRVVQGLCYALGQTKDLNTLVFNLSFGGFDPILPVEEILSEAIENMQRIFTGVHGKLGDLCRPMQRKYAQVRHHIISYSGLVYHIVSHHITSHHILFSSDTLCTVLRMYSIFILWYGKLNDIIALIGSS